MYYNKEHYKDPTAGRAIAKVSKEERKRMTQAEFYKSMAWRRARQAYINERIAIDGGLCEVCGQELGLIVHHTIWLNDRNCNNPDIALNPKHFKYECQGCHNKEKDPSVNKSSRIKYGPNGEVIKRGDY